MFKNFILLIISIISVLFIGEVIARHIYIPAIAKLYSCDIPYVYKNFGRFNPNTGIFQPNNTSKGSKIYFFPPHLRGTPVNPSAIHILVLGDSFTFGLFLPWNDTYVFKLQKKLDQYFGSEHYQLLNAATPGWGSSQYLSYLEHYGIKTSPKYVLIFLNTDDIGRSMKDDTLPYCKMDKIKYKKIGAKARILPLPNSIKNWFFHSWFFQHSALIHLLYNTAIAVAFPNKNEQKFLIPMSTDFLYSKQSVIKCGESVFLKINKWCVKHHAKLLVVTTGFNDFYPDETHDPTEIFLKHAKTFFAKNDIAYFDIGPRFKEMVSNKMFEIPRDGHPNAFGAKAIAESSWPWIKHQIIISAGKAK